MIVYVDASAVVKLLVEEQHSAAVADYLDSAGAASDRVVSAGLLDTEVRRFAGRVGVAQDAVTAVLAGIDRSDLDLGLLRAAGLLPGSHLRSLDAIHVASALSLRADELVTYDARMVATARNVGLLVVSPGQDAAG